MLEWLVGVKHWWDRVTGSVEWFSWLNQWWATLDFTLQIYWFIALLASIVLFFQTLLTLFGVGADELDIDMNIDDVAGMGVLSFRSVNAFFVGFGWSGVIALQSGLSLASAVPISVATGGLLMSVVYWIMRFFYGLQASGNVNLQNAVGLTGSVYLPIPPDRSGTGQVELLIQGQSRLVTALNNSNQQITRNCRVKIVEQIDASTVIVEPIGVPPSSDVTGS